MNNPVVLVEYGHINLHQICTEEPNNVFSFVMGAKENTVVDGNRVFDYVRIPEVKSEEDYLKLLRKRFKVNAIARPQMATVGMMFVSADNDGKYARPVITGKYADAAEKVARSVFEMYEKKGKMQWS